MKFDAGKFLVAKAKIATKKARRTHFMFIPRKVASDGFSGLILDATIRNTKCAHCKEKIQFGFVVARYRGTQSACQNLYFHKCCLINLLDTTLITKKSSAICLICGKGETDWKFKCEGHAYNYGGYHRDCIRKFVDNHSAEHDLYSGKLATCSIDIEDVVREYKSKRAEWQRIISLPVKEEERILERQW